MLAQTFNLLKEQIKKHPEVATGFLSYTDQWKTAHYNQLSSIINENLQKNEILKGERKFELGNTISAITLKRFFEGSISENATNDLRFIKTLDKICIFLGYTSFNEFLSKKDFNNIFSKEKASGIYELIIFETAKNEFESLKKLPEISLENIGRFVHPGSPYYHRIESYLNRLKEQQLQLIPKTSSFEVYSVALSQEEEHLKVISTREFWNLNFIDAEGKPHHYHILNEQNYFIKKMGDDWKIWDNYNPNVWELTEKI